MLQLLPSDEPDKRLLVGGTILLLPFVTRFPFCLICTLVWRLRSSERANLRPHTSQLNGFSPVCVRT